MSPLPLLTILADIYTPALGAFYLHRLLRTNGTARRALLGALLFNLAVAWGLMFADHIWDIWRVWSLDYSTHTAVALTLIVCLCFSAPRQITWWIGSLAVYAAMMVALGYHSIADIASTVLLTGSLMLPMAVWCHKKIRSYRSSSSQD